MRVINFFAGPGAGKSTTAAGLFYYMKKLGMSVELVTEFAKELVWENAKEVMADQLYLLANQNRRLERLRGRVDYAIADSPLLIAAYYGKYYGNHPEIIVPFCYQIFNTYDNTNFFIERTKPYIKLGRFGSEEEARKSDEEIREMLGGMYISIKDDENIIENCLSILLSNK